MKRHIIIEGADGCGKTFLAQHLERAHGYHYHHEGPPPGDVDFLSDYYRGVVEGRKDIRTVYDRMFYGEMVYGPIFRGETKINYPQLGKLIGQFRAMGGLTILMLPPYDVLYRQLYDQTREFTEFEKNEINHHRVHVGFHKLRDRFDVVMTDRTIDCENVLGVSFTEECHAFQRRAPQ